MATHDGEKHSRQSLRDSEEFRELAELMAGIAPDRRGDAFGMVERQDEFGNGEETSRAHNTPRRTQASGDEFGKDVLSTDG